MAVASRSVPTVIVTRRARPGYEREFERWVHRLVAEAGEAPGFLDAEIQRPDGVHPGEWVVIYRFGDAPSLHAWLRSPARAALVATGADLVDGEPREQVVALDALPSPVTAVASVRVRPGAAGDVRALHGELLDVLAGTEGFVRADVFEPVEGVQDDTVIVFAFDDREHLDRWLASDERRSILARMDALTEGERTVNVVGGFAGWFASPGAPAVRRWKQAVAVLLALVPTSLAYAFARAALLPALPTVVAVIAGNVAGVVVLTWILMPWITRRLDRWLRR